MKLNRILYSISIMMVIALFGLLIIQFMWIRESYNLKEDNFDRIVRSIIDETLQKEHDRSQVIELTEVLPGIIDDSVQFYFNSRSGSRVFLKDETMPSVHDDSLTAHVYISQTSGTNSGGGHSVAIVSSDDSTMNLMTGMNSEERDGTEKGLGSERLIAMKYDIVENEDGLHELRTEIDELIAKEHNIVLKKVEEAEKLIEKMAIEYSFKNVGSMNRVVPEKLRSAIHDNLSKNGVELDFNMSINDDNADSMIWTTDQEVIGMDDFKIYEFDLFPNDIVEKPEKLQISFPDRERYILGSMWIMMLISLLITGLLISVSVYSVHTLFRQKRLADVKSDFINNMTHEFKTPISTISVATDALANDAVGEDVGRVRYYARIIGEENRKLNSNVENILQLALFDKGEVELHKECIKINEFIKDTLRPFELRVSNVSGDLRTALSEKDPVVEIDPLYFSVVLNNLIDNAIKYSGSAPPDIVVNSFVNDGEVSISVRDHGIGMTRDEQKHIFEKFYRVTRGVIHDVKGFGLGLSYVKLIVQAHGGSVQVESSEGGGSTFTVKMGAV
jgi:signal transduction histidine kinase